MISLHLLHLRSSSFFLSSHYYSSLCYYVSAVSHVINFIGNWLNRSLGWMEHGMSESNCFVANTFTFPFESTNFETNHSIHTTTYRFRYGKTRRYQHNLFRFIQCYRALFQYCRYCCSWWCSQILLLVQTTILLYYYI